MPKNKKGPRLTMEIASHKIEAVARAVEEVGDKLTIHVGSPIGGTAGITDALAFAWFYRESDVQIFRNGDDTLRVEVSPSGFGRSIKPARRPR